MGDRSVIVITTEASYLDTITLYGHNSGGDNLLAVQQVLGRYEARVGDISYLTSQLFYEFAVALGGYTGGLGYGIFAGNAEESGDSNNPPVIVDADTGNYTYDGKTFDRDGINQEEEI